MRKLLLSLSVLSLAALTSCKEDAVTPTPDPSVRAGSTLAFEHKAYDEDTTFTNVSYMDTTVFTVLSTDTTFASESKAHFLTSIIDTSVYRVDDDKNIAVWQPEIEIPTTGVFYPQSWPVLPITTNEAVIVAFEHDTAVTLQGYPAIVNTKMTSGYIGEGSIIINGETYTTQEAFVQRRVSVAVAGQIAYTDVYTQYSYSPELKTFVARKQKVFSNHNRSPIPNGGETWTLISFTL
jgi:hypothetical protein